ncbi:flagellar FlbD family protein [Cellulomonas sp. SLBN-39]|uniref:flagellar FlbD family protein n=1 Tax=Cellulomonas sp. SLBN-39 TaxID=2768446 RepID=UPI00114DE7A6|nr:flagellar FlbD family protein [Cellulomonas sp. SLBN-39]TQL01628.1 flagellar protein FlbD [Cellulomonas sp. SLBN-39]
MIVVTRLNGGQFGVNPDLIQRVDRAPDTILTLIDGTKFIVRESLDEVIELVTAYRAGLLARSREVDRGPRMELVPAPEAETEPTPPVPLRPRSV